MGLLLDTHVLLWYLEGKTQLPPKTRLRISYGIEPVFISPATWWEMAIKIGQEKLKLEADLPTLLRLSDAAFFKLLPISSAHILQVSRLPYPSSGHRDPFDRLLIAQAQVENLTLLSCDGHFKDYAVRHEF